MSDHYLLSFSIATVSRSHPSHKADTSLFLYNFSRVNKKNKQSTDRIFRKPLILYLTTNSSINFGKLELLAISCSGLSSLASPQGSVLGPLLFSNELPDKILSADPFLFADDIKLAKCINSSISEQDFELEDQDKTLIVFHLGVIPGVSL